MAPLLTPIILKFSFFPIGNDRVKCGLRNEISIMKYSHLLETEGKDVIICDFLDGTETN